MSRPVIITGLGPVSALGMGIDANWDAWRDGRSAIAPIEAFDASAFHSRIAGEVRDLKVRDFVPKTYRKATKVMARDIEIAVACADLAARNAGLATKGTAPDAEPTYAPARVGAHIGAGLIAADLDELAAALTEATDEQGRFDIHKWGKEGMFHLTPLWLLKYLPNMLACHVTIIHDAQGPSNTITCNEASGPLSVGESLRVIQRGMADACFCGGADSKINPMAFLRQQYTGRLNVDDNDRPTEAVRPFSSDAAGSAAAEGGGILVIEAVESYEKRGGDGEPYARVAGFGASQTVHRASRNLKPDPDGRAIAGAIRRAINEAGIKADEIDMIVPFGCGSPVWDSAEASALETVFGDRLSDVPIRSTKPVAGNAGAGAGALDLCLAARAMREQTVPSAINCDEPIGNLNAGNAPASKAELRHVLCYATGVGGQNAAIVLGRV
ncbi:beta-ketoacyl synthase [Phycisphaerales bacterium AB-hyl4]|uniref:Beta-ketoacyl synthase n=1 Tax=Natronomicrosphaera hydrolytica TaxID=3242702 RepID=A0ABV4UBA9_9BACT